MSILQLTQQASRQCAFFVTALSLLYPFAAAAQSGAGPAPGAGHIAIDISSATAVLDLLARGNVTEAEAEQVAQLPGVQSLIRKANGFDPAATEAQWKASFRAASTDAPLGADPFSFARVKNRSAATRALLARIAADTQAFASEIRTRVAAYSPPNVPLSATVQVVAGGTSDGWVTGAGVFYVAVDYFSGDYEGFLLVCAHELYHLAQGAFLPKIVSATAPPPVLLLRALVQEGTASWMADPRAVEGGEYINWFRAKYRRNFARIASNFALFETLLYRAHNDREANYGALYGLGFSGTWDSPLYFVGHRIAEQIEKYDGRAGLIAIMQRPHAEFVRRYIQLNREHSEDTNFIPLSPSIVLLLEEI